MTNVAYANLIAACFGMVTFLFGYSIGADYYEIWEVAVIIFLDIATIYLLIKIAENENII